MTVCSLGIQNELRFADLHYNSVVSLGLSILNGVCFNLPLGFNLVPTNVACRWVIWDLVGL